MSQILNTPVTFPGEGTVTDVIGGNNITITGVSTVAPVVNVSGTVDHSLLIGNALGAISNLGVATDGQLPIGSSGADPVLSTLTAGANITITNGPGTITIMSSAPGTGTVTSLSAATGITLTPNPITTTGTIGLTVPVVVSSGGTGQITLTANGVLVGEGTSPINQVVGTTNNVLLGNTGADPSFGKVPNAALANSTITLSNGNNITVTGSPVALGGTASFNLTGTTTNAVQIGNASGSLTSIAVGATNTVLLGNTAADPSFGTVPNAALANSSITLANGNNITITGSPVALGGTATVNVSGTTNNSLLIGNASGSITSLGSALNGQLPIGSTGATPVLSTLTAGANITITNGAGVITIASAASTITSVTGTANQITASPTTGAVVLSIPSTFIAPGSIAATTSVTATLGNITATSGNFALTAATSSTVGQITQAGTRIFHTFGTRNTFVGASSGNFTLTSGTANDNVGLGITLAGLTTGTENCCVGNSAGNAITSGTNNTIMGYNSGSGLLSGTGNELYGVSAGANYTGAESYNICIGNSGVASESHVIRLGAQGSGNYQQNSCFIAGITGVTVTGTAVLCSTTGLLGTVASSRKFKNNIQDMDDSHVIHQLRPTTFAMNNDETNHKQWGFIAEEVHDIYPNLVNYDNGEPHSVRYLDMIPMLVAEVQKLRKELDSLKGDK